MKGTWNYIGGASVAIVHIVLYNTLVVCVLRDLCFLPEGSRSNRLWTGWCEPFRMSYHFEGVDVAQGWKLGVSDVLCRLVICFLSLYRSSSAPCPWCPSACSH